MTNQKLLDMFTEAFPDETVQRGQRLRLSQVEIVNAIALELKQRRIGVAHLELPAKPNPHNIPLRPAVTRPTGLGTVEDLTMEQSK
jgi:hypothetical protein